MITICLCFLKLIWFSSFLQLLLLLLFVVFKIMQKRSVKEINVQQEYTRSTTFILHCPSAWNLCQHTQNLYNWPLDNISYRPKCSENSKNYRKNQHKQKNLPRKNKWNGKLGEKKLLQCHGPPDEFQIVKD